MLKPFKTSLLLFLVLFAPTNAFTAETEGYSCFGKPYETEYSANEYITHHLSHCVVDSPLGPIHIDSVFYSVFMAFVFLLTFYAFARKASPGIPGKGQSFIEIIIEFVDEQV